jgi:thiamine biosynthesis protein ThiC
MTQLQSARKGMITPEMVRVAQRERVTPGVIRDGVARRAWSERSIRTEIRAESPGNDPARR